MKVNPLQKFEDELLDKVKEWLDDPKTNDVKKDVATCEVGNDMFVRVLTRLTWLEDTVSRAIHYSLLMSSRVLHKTPHNRLLQVVLVHPQIPGNTGCIVRTCAASAVGLHLVGPLGFQVDDTKLKRAGLDYWPYVVVKVHNSWADFRNFFIHQVLLGSPTLVVDLKIEINMLLIVFV
ncbi:uncharacterized protein LOC124909564 [Impatiens glandulifera]|uniref:uncharacterized protein LOC124909564 n=1 Tax=Impatiens glandulifera TaxID=253017 RepID=UPI001FB0C957|nr:uncharacterized protein LOC124909564 [Impatiens glandulifera]